MTTSIDFKKVVLCFILTIGCSLAFSGAAFAEGNGAGVKIGISADPEQVYFGAHANVAEVVPELWLRPNVEVGVGNDLTVVTLNGEFVYHFKIHAKDWQPYVGAGPSVVIVSASSSTGRNSDAGPGFNFLMGIEKRRGMLAEIKVGAIDSPGFKFGLGWNF